MHDLSASADHTDVRQELVCLLTEDLYGSDLDWVREGALVGSPDKEFQPSPNRGLSGQRGWR